MASSDSEPRGDLATALSHARQLLAGDAVKAEAQLREILNVVPDQPEALYLLGLALGAQDRGEDSIAALGRATARDPRHAAAWRALGDQLTLAGDGEAADRAYAQHLKAAANDPALAAAAAALCDNKLGVAEQMLRDFLKENPTDVGAIRMLAEVGARLGRYEDAEKLLARAVALAPGFDAARANFATVLHRQGKSAEALSQVELLLVKEPNNSAYRNLEAAVLARLGETSRAIDAYEVVLRAHPRQPKAWMSLGHTLKTAGRHREAVEAYRKSIALLPSLGEAYWSLANLKTFLFTADDVAQMEAQLERGTLTPEDRFHLHFALGKAFEDEGDFARSFAAYDQANTLRRAVLDYRADEITDMVRRTKTFFTAEFFRAHAGAGAGAPDPIFVVGLPRSGSTLVEQILSSHSAIEGTMELPDILAIARRLGGGKKRIEESDYPAVLAALQAEDFKALGAEYIARTRPQRKLGRPFFVDKMPNNFLHVGLIHLILPNAKIIDARRHPMACCFSCFKQHFARGQGFTYSLSDIGRYYADYADLMAHFDTVLPGRVHRVFYESMVRDPEAQIRRLLDYCGVPFEENCLFFYRNDRIVRTASSEQVRMPMFSDAVEHWRNFEPWLEPLKQALAPVLDANPSPRDGTAKP